MNIFRKDSRQLSSNILFTRILGQNHASRMRDCQGGAGHELMSRDDMDRATCLGAGFVVSFQPDGRRTHHIIVRDGDIDAHGCK